MMRALVFAEAIKLRRSAPVWLAGIAPLVLFLLHLLTLFSRSHVEPRAAVVLWRDLLTFPWVLWLGMFVPVLVIFETISLASMEHGGRHWKQLFALPIPRWRFFAVKMFFCALLLGASYLLFACGAIGGVLIFSWARGLGLAGSIPWADVLGIGCRAYLASWLMIVAQTWLSMRFRGFAIPAATGAAALLFGFMLMGFRRDAFGWWYPWILPINVRPEGLYDAHNTLAPALFGAVAGLILALVAARDLGRRIEDI